MPQYYWFRLTRVKEAKETPKARRWPECLSVHRVRLDASAANASGFLLASLSKTRRIDIPRSTPKLCSEAFPIKASDYSESMR
jgi:hypothetical protein